jgi:hypothetical protein
MIFKAMESKGQLDYLQVLLLWLKIGKLPDGVMDVIRAQLDCSNVVKRLVDEVSNNSALSNTGCFLNDVAQSAEGELILRDTVNIVMQNFDMVNIQEMMLLIYFSMGFENETSCFFIDILLTELEEGSMLDTEHALNLWASA